MGIFDWRVRKEKITPAAPAKPVHPYTAVEICPADGENCAAAREAAGKRFLSARAPRLPLPGCDRARCACSYKRHQDRRGGRRRFSELGLHLAAKSSPGDGERRTQAPRGRRKSDGR